VFDHHPTTNVLNILKGVGADITDEVVNQGAEGLDMRQVARRAADR
jgi:membrane carboxypeptidase/penicillin-binding protein PbpC